MNQRGRGRPPKYPSDEVRSRLLDAAQEMLRTHGVRGGLDAVTLDAAILAAEVPRGSAYKLWQSESMSPQDAFRTAVVMEVFLMPATNGLPATSEFIEEELKRHAALIADGTPAQMAWLARELMRTVGEHNFEQIDASQNWRIYSALRTGATTQPVVSPEVLDALREGEEYLIEQYSLLYEKISQLFSMRVREPFTVQEFAACLYSVNEGLAGRLSSNYRKRGIPRPTGPDGEMQPWTLFSVAFEALVEFFWEPID